MYTKKMSHTPDLCYAVLHKDMPLVKKLLESGVSPDTPDICGGFIPLRYADLEFTKLLCKYGAHVETRSVGSVCSGDDAEKLEYLLEKQLVDPNVISCMRGTPLHYLAYDPKFVEVLLRYGANPNIRDSYYNRTPIFSVRNVHIARLLLDYGADLNVKDIHGSPPQYYAIGEIYHLFIDYGLYVSPTDWIYNPIAKKYKENTKQSMLLLALKLFGIFPCEVIEYIGQLTIPMCVTFPCTHSTHYQCEACRGGTPAPP